MLKGRLAGRRLTVVSPLLLLLSLPFLRPNVASTSLASVGSALVIAAALVAFADDRGSTKVPRPYIILSVFVLALSLWALVNSALFGQAIVQNILQGFVTTALTVACAGFVIAEPTRCRIVVSGFVWIVSALCVSYVVTAILGLVVGVQSLTIGTFVFNDAQGYQITAYFPFTFSTGSFNTLGVSIPRFVGLAREPGWMALYCGIAALLVGKAWPFRRWVRSVLIIGLIGTISTAGFGAFVVVVALSSLLQRSQRGDIFQKYLKFLLRITVLAGAAWLAVDAPVVGLAAKSVTNLTSLNIRSQATEVGLSSILQFPFGGSTDPSASGINLIAGLAVSGWPSLVIVVLAIFLPLAGNTMRSSAVAVAMLVFITLLLSQPAGDSTFIFMILGVVYCAPPHTDSEVSPAADSRLKRARKARFSLRI